MASQPLSCAALWRCMLLVMLLQHPQSHRCEHSVLFRLVQLAKMMSLPLILPRIFSTTATNCT